MAVDTITIVTLSLVDVTELCLLISTFLAVSFNFDLDKFSMDVD